MKTIEKILKYRFFEEKLKFLKNMWFINWCWAKWSFNFSEFVKKNISEFENFLPNKNIFSDLEKCCNEHDLEFMFFREKFFWFFRANFNFCYKIFQLLHWANFSERFWVAIIIFFALQNFWKEAFEKSPSLTIDCIYLIINNYDWKTK